MLLKDLLLTMLFGFSLGLSIESIQREAMYLEHAINWGGCDCPRLRDIVRDKMKNHPLLGCDRSEVKSALGIPAITSDDENANEIWFFEDPKLRIDFRDGRCCKVIDLTITRIH
jgi:hypothetical protein